MPSASSDESGGRPVVGLLLGDPCGVGPELVARLLTDPAVTSQATTVVVGSDAVLRRGLAVSGGEPPVQRVTELSAATLAAAQPGTPLLLDTVPLDLDAVPVGAVSVAAGRYALDTLRTAAELARAGTIGGFCYASLNKQALHEAGSPFPDELHFLADHLGVTSVCRELNLVDQLWTARVTSHVPLREVAAGVTGEAIEAMIGLTARTIGATGVLEPRLAVAALNPHAGDGGLIGREEIEIIAPAVAAARRTGIDVDGPFPADAVFALARDGGYHGVVTMYHDQGGIAMKLLSDDFGITVLAGLPFPVTTASHGTAFDIAGRGVARVASLRQAFLTCCALVEG